MTRNRERKARIRVRQRVTGETFTQAARHTGQQRRPIQDLLEDAAAGLRAAGTTDTTDTTAVLQAAWTALCTIGAAGQILSICADPDHYPACWLLAEPVLAEAIQNMRATPALRGTSTEINPDGSPDTKIANASARQICRLLTETADALDATLSHAASHARAKAARRACRAGAAAGQRAARIYRAGKTVRPSLAAAARHPEWLQAHTRNELQQVIDSHHEQLQVADPADTAAALTAAWYGFAVTFMLGQFLAHRNPDDATVHRNALPVIARIIEVLEAAPSMPAEIHGAGLDTTPAADPAMMATARRGIWDLTLAINALLPEVARLAAHEADRAAATTATGLASELIECYVGRLRTFLNPYGRAPGAASLVLRSKTQPRRNRRRPPGS